jgi:hypothetical protein
MLINFSVVKGTPYCIGLYRRSALLWTRKLCYSLPLKEWFAPVVLLTAQQEMLVKRGIKE